MERSLLRKPNSCRPVAATNGGHQKEWNDQRMDESSYCIGVGIDMIEQQCV